MAVKKPDNAPVDGPLIGAHHSIAGGIALAFERAHRSGCRALQVFTKNSNQWHAKPLSPEDIASYKTAATNSTIRHVVSHDSYLINLCAVNPDVLRKSREAFLDEIRRCEQLGIGLLNFHPGAHMGAGTGDGIKRIIESLDLAHAATPRSTVLSVLETTAGQGTVVGSRFEELRAIIDGVADPSRMAVCIDTCHIFAAGYDISKEKTYAQVMDEFEGIIGFSRLAAMHVNDSKKGLGSHLDRHEHIGKGAIGRAGFRLIMRDPRLASIPKILETPKGEDLREDKVNLALLRRLAKL